MISRYTRPQMAQIWAPATRFRIWFEIEAHAATAMAELGLIPENRRRLMCLSMFWHFLDVVWIGVFTFVYLMGVM